MSVKKIVQSFIESAQDSFYPIQNLPYGVFKQGENQSAHIGVAIGDFVLDLTRLEQAGLLTSDHHKPLFQHETLNYFASCGNHISQQIRARIQSLLSTDNPELQKNSSFLSQVLIPQSDITLLMPFKIEGFSDFYASIHHATNVGKLFRGKENALMPNWKHLPVGYNGRASTVFLSGTNIPRPKGQIKLPDQDLPIFSASNKLDFELELGVFIGKGNADGRRISTHEAKQHLFGMVLLNDWSARDIQAFEYQPLGPFLSKSFATSISPWVVPMAALEEFMSPLPKQIPERVHYLKEEMPKQPDLKLKVELQAKGASSKTLLCETSAKELYWSMEQILAHHTVNHCIMRPGDLLGSGTISGETRESWGSLLEITFNGTQPIQLPDGSSRTFLEDGDTIIMTGYCETSDYKIGFGQLEGTILQAIP